MAARKPWYQTLFEREYYDYFYIGGPRGLMSEEVRDRLTDAQVEFVVGALELPEGARVLDLCCGWGRHSVRLAQRGYRVTGLELSVHHLRLAKAAAKRARVDVEWLQADMREIPRRRFDAVINMFTSWGYFDTEAEDQRVLDGVARALKPGGRFLIDTLNHDYLMRVFRQTDWDRRRDGGFALQRRRYTPLTSRIENDWYYFAADGKRRHQSFSHRVYTARELAIMLEQAGLNVQRAWGNFDGSELTMESPRAILLAEKG
ncbi:MAG: class I SAM-dependent methyltransferase [Dehalococcoidia bacterium]